MDTLASRKKTGPALNVRFPSKEAYDKIREAVAASNSGSVNAFIVAVTIDAAETVLKGKSTTPGHIAGENLIQT